MVVEKQRLEETCKKCGRRFSYLYRGFGKRNSFCIECCPKKGTRKIEDEYYVDDSSTKPKLNNEHKLKNKAEYNSLYYQKNRERILQHRKQRYENSEKQNNIKQQTGYFVPDKMIEIDDNETKNVNDSQYEKFWNKMLMILSKVDTIRVELCNFSSELYQYKSNYDKEDQIFLHEVEDIDGENALECQQFVKKFKASRNSRRDVKDILDIISPIIDAIPIKNVAQAHNKGVLQNGYKREYNPNK